jgi:hypothetical protein
LILISLLSIFGGCLPRFLVIPLSRSKFLDELLDLSIFQSKLAEFYFEGKSWEADNQEFCYPKAVMQGSR